MKFYTIFILSFLFLLGSCIVDGSQGEPGDQGPVGPIGPDAKTFDFTLTFNPGDEWESYDSIIGYDTGDVVLVYLLSGNYDGSDHYVPLPYNYKSNGINDLIYIWPEFSSLNGSLFINTTWANGNSGSPWINPVDLKFRAILIQSSYKKAFPEVDFKDYESIKQELRLNY